MTGGERYYKFLDAKGRGAHSGFFWPLPEGDAPSAWVEVAGELVACENGLHAARAGDCLSWLDETAYELEYDGEVIEADDKVLGRKARLVRRLHWDERSARHFACDCAERALPLYEARYPGDARPREAIVTARRFADGAATGAELVAAGDAAGDAARAAARAAAWDAARAAAWAAAGAAAGYAAGAAAGAAAGDAARDAARDAAGDAAGDAARAAERAWQAGRLVAYLHGMVGSPGGATATEVAR